MTLANVQRGTGREAMIEEAAKVLRAGQELRVLDIAKAAGVSHSLIYRHFPQGGREELIAEAYARIFRAHVSEDLAAFAKFSSEPAEMRRQLQALFEGILTRERAEDRWARLESLAQGRTNPHVEARINATKEELLGEMARLMMALPRWQLSETQAVAFSTLMLSLPLGLTPLVEPHATPAQRTAIAAVWTTMVLVTVAALDEQSGENHEQSGENQ